MSYTASPSVKFKTEWLFYISGFGGILLINNSLLTMLIYRYDPGLPNPENLPFLISSALVGVAIFISRIVGAIAQPIVGYASDRLQSPFGKRRPFLAIATLPLVLSFILLFTPPLSITSVGSLLYLVILLCVFYLAFASYQIPYLAWLPTLAQTADQKVTLSTGLAAAGLSGSAMGAIGAPWLSQTYGFYSMALMLGSLGFICLLMPLCIPERLQSQNANNQNYPPFWKALKVGWNNSAFRIYSAGIAAAWIATSIFSLCPTFLAVALLNKDISFGGVINGVMFGGTILGFIPVSLLVRRWGKGQTFQLSMIWLGCGLVAISIMPFFVGTTVSPWLVLLLIGNLGAASFFILPNAMLPDVIHHGTQTPGIRQEAVYFGIRGLLVEASIGFGSLVAGLVLSLGKTSEQPWGVLIAFPIAGLFALAAAGVFSFYPIKQA